MPEGGPRHRLDIVARRPENAVAPSWRGSVPLAFAFATSPALIEIETAVAVLALSVAFPSEGFSDAPCEHRRCCRVNGFSENIW
jgi:hypothetical protein